MRNTKWTRFCETILREGGFAKPRLMFLKFGGVWVSAPQEGAGGMRGGYSNDQARFDDFNQIMFIVINTVARKNNNFTTFLFN